MVLLEEKKPLESRCRCFDLEKKSHSQSGMKLHNQNHNVWKLPKIVSFEFFAPKISIFTVCIWILTQKCYEMRLFLNFQTLCQKLFWRFWCHGMLYMSQYFICDSKYEKKYTTFYHRIVFIAFAAFFRLSENAQGNISSGNCNTTNSFWSERSELLINAWVLKSNFFPQNLRVFGVFGSLHSIKKSIY